MFLDCIVLLVVEGGNQTERIHQINLDIKKTMCKVAQALSRRKMYQMFKIEKPMHYALILVQKNVKA